VQNKQPETPNPSKMGQNEGFYAPDEPPATPNDLADGPNEPSATPNELEVAIFTQSDRSNGSADTPDAPADGSEKLED
jgi:hypothetical protein